MRWAQAGGPCLAGLMALAMTARAADAEPFDPAGSRAGITVDLRVAGKVDGRFGRVEGELHPVGDGRWQVQARIDAAALKLDGPAWMQRSTRSSRSNSRDGGELAGDLSLRGRTRPVGFRIEPSTCDTPGHACPIRVRGTVSRRAFGMVAQRLWLRDEVGFEFQVRLRGSGS